MCLLIPLRLLSKTFPIIRRIQEEMIKKCVLASCRVPVILARFQRNLRFPDTFSNNTQTSNFMNIRSAGAELFRADGQTDGHDEANSRFSQFCEGP
jgi:hypothetical protein